MGGGDMGKKPGKKVRRRSIARGRNSSLLSEVKTVVRPARKAKALPGSRGLAKYFMGEPPTGLIIRNSGGPSPEAVWVRDTLLE
jgi:hypothetical protein